jgi:hypothetical protein
MRWGYGGQRRSCNGEEGGGGELDAPWMKTTRGGIRLRSPWVCSQRRRRPDSDELRTHTVVWLRTAVAARSERARRGGSDSGGGADGTTLSRRWRTVPTALFMHWSGMARGSHAATARCQAGLARRTASNRWDPLVCVFRIKIIPDENRSK